MHDDIPSPTHIYRGIFLPSTVRMVPSAPAPFALVFAFPGVSQKQIELSKTNEACEFYTQTLHPITLHSNPKP
jgi:hypothetical protein